MADVTGNETEEFGEYSMLDQLPRSRPIFSTQPLFPPESMWTAPSELPALTGATILGLDLETHDPNLKKHGPGGVRNDGYIAGVSVYTPEHGSYYVPIRHPDTPRQFEWSRVKEWLHALCMRDIPVVGANISYDLEWLRAQGMGTVPRNLHDIQIAEPLLDENKEMGYSLEVLGKEYIGAGKDEKLLHEALLAYGLGNKNALAQLPARYVGPYAEYDAELAVLVFQQQSPRILDQDLSEVYDLERSLIPLLLDMRFRGVRVNTDRAEELNKELKKEEIGFIDELKLNPYSGLDIARRCDELGIWYPRTEGGNPSFEAEFLRSSKEEFLQKIAAYRKINKMRSDFIEGDILQRSINGRLHAQFHPLRRDEQGTRSGRFSSTNPNLQQIPSRDPYWGPLIRSLFIPEAGCDWAKLDYSQQEPRILVHYADFIGLTGAKTAVNAFTTDPRTDFHQLTAVIAGIERNQAKTINLGLSYGMGVKKLATKLGLSVGEAKAVIEKYHQNMPFVRGLISACDNRAAQQGFIRTILGRRRRFDNWEPTWREQGEGWTTLPLDAAKEAWPNRTLKRAGTYKAINAVIQGTAADQTKKAMLDMYREGFIPHIQVHDEIDISIENREQGARIKEIMEETIQFRVPMKADLEIGPSWGEIIKEVE